MYLDVDFEKDIVLCEVPFGGVLFINNLVPHRRYVFCCCFKTYLFLCSLMGFFFLSPDVGSLNGCRPVSSWANTLVLEVFWAPAKWSPNDRQVAHVCPTCYDMLGIVGQIFHITFIAYKECWPKTGFRLHRGLVVRLICFKQGRALRKRVNANPK